MPESKKQKEILKSMEKLLSSDLGLKSEFQVLAKLEMMKSKYSHPFYWAAFVLNGDYASKIDFDISN